MHLLKNNYLLFFTFFHLYIKFQILLTYLDFSVKWNKYTIIINTFQLCVKKKQLKFYFVSIIFKKVHKQKSQGGSTEQTARTNKIKVSIF